jgi:hypothetical protein
VTAVTQQYAPPEQQQPSEAQRATPSQPAAHRPYELPEAGVRSFSTTGVTVLHTFTGLVCWGFVAFAWWRLGYMLTASDVFRDVGSALMLAVLGALITGYWVFINLYMVRRRGEKRRDLRRVSYEWTEDYLGRRYVGSLEACKRANYVVQTYSWRDKVYRPLPLSELGQELVLKGCEDHVEMGRTEGRG